MLKQAQLEEATQPSSPGLGLMPAMLAAQCQAASKSLVIKWGSVYHHGERNHFSQSLRRSTSLVGTYPKEPEPREAEIHVAGGVFPPAPLPVSLCSCSQIRASAHGNPEPLQWRSSPTHSMLGSCLAPSLC